MEVENAGQEIIGWRIIHNTTIYTFLAYLNWWSTLVVGFMSFLPMLSDDCKPQTMTFLTQLSWMEIVTFVNMVAQSMLLSALLTGVKTDIDEKYARWTVNLHTFVSMLPPILLLVLTTVPAEWSVTGAKIIFQYHFAQLVVNSFCTHNAVVKYVKSLGVWLIANGLCEYSRVPCPANMSTGQTTFIYRSCYNEYHLSAVQILVTMSLATPYIIKVIQAVVSPVIKEPIYAERPQPGPSRGPQSAPSRSPQPDLLPVSPGLRQPRYDDVFSPPTGSGVQLSLHSHTRDTGLDHADDSSESE